MLKSIFTDPSRQILSKYKTEVEQINNLENNSSDDNSVSSLDDIEGDFTYTATPTSIIDDLSIPGAFAQHSQCSNKRCCNDTECSNYHDIGEFAYTCTFIT